MRSVFRGIAALIALAVVVQAAAIAFVTFGVINEVEGGTVIDDSFEPNFGAALHGMVGMMVIPVLALLLLVASFFARVHRGRTAAGLLLIAVVAQVLLAFASFGAPIVGMLHGANAFVILGLAVMALRAQPVEAHAAVDVAPRVSAQRAAGV